MDVILHLGAHRTGTTTLQQYLNKNSDNLRGIDTEIWTPKRTRSGLFSGLVKNPADITRETLRRGNRSLGLIRMEMDRLAVSGTKSLIVSEENMIGGMKNNLATARLYPNAQARLDRFADGFGFQCRRIVLSIRSYEKYWASVLAFTVQRGWAMPDQEILDRLVTQPRRWRDVIKEVASVFPAAELVVWPFEALAGQPDRQLGMINGGVIPITMRGRREWHNASANCARLRQVLFDRGDRAQALDLPDDDTRWQPFQTHHIMALRAQYNEDIAWLRGGADGIATYTENSSTGYAGIHPQPEQMERGHFHDQKERIMV